MCLAISVDQVSSRPATKQQQEKNQKKIEPLQHSEFRPLIHWVRTGNFCRCMDEMQVTSSPQLQKKYESDAATIPVTPKITFNAVGEYPICDWQVSSTVVWLWVDLPPSVARWIDLGSAR